MTAMRRTVRVLLILIVSSPYACTPSAPPADNANTNDNSSGAPADRVGSGTARLSGVIYSADSDVNIPLAGTVFVLGDSVAIAKANGAFDLFGAPAGLQPLLIDGSRIPAGDGQYGQYAAHFNVLEGEQRLLEEPVYLPLIRNAQKIGVARTSETLLSGGGMTIRIPPGAARDDEAAYGEWVALLPVETARAPLPLPSELKESVTALFTLQPLGVEFPAPLPPRIQSVEQDPYPYASLMQVSFATGEWMDAGSLERTGDRWETLGGGVRGSGWFMVHQDLHLKMYESCGDLDSASCLRAWGEVRAALARLGEGRVAGAAETLKLLALAVVNREPSLAGAQSLIEEALDDFRVARGNLAQMAAVYARADDGAALKLLLEGAPRTCGSAEVCDGQVSDVSAQIGRLSRSVQELLTNLSVNSSKMQRIAAAVEALDGYFELIDPLDEDTLPAFDLAANEFLEAFAAFTPLKSPAEANDAFLALLEDCDENAVGVLDGLRQPASPGGASRALTVELAAPDGVRAYADATGSVAAFRPRTAPADPLLWSVDLHRGACSLPSPLRETLRTARYPLEVTLDRRLRTGELADGVPAASSLSVDAPGQAWTIRAPQRQGVEVTLFADSNILAGLAVSDGLMLSAVSGGFHVSNLPPGGPYHLMVAAAGFPSASQIDYRIQYDVDDALFTFGEPLRGAFDIVRRAEVVLFEGERGEQVIVDLRCCGSAASGMNYGLFDPSGSSLAPSPGSAGAGGLGTSRFELMETGLHRLILTPEEGVFTDYELVLTKVAPEPPLDYHPGTELTLDFGQNADSITLRFAAGGGDLAELHGLAAEGIDRLSVHVESEDGQVVVDQAVVYFDGTSFSRLPFVIPADAAYLLTLAAVAQGQPASGRATIRMDLAAGPVDP